MNLNPVPALPTSGNGNPKPTAPVFSQGNGLEDSQQLQGNTMSISQQMSGFTCKWKSSSINQSIHPSISTRCIIQHPILSSPTLIHIMSYHNPMCYLYGISSSSLYSGEKMDLSCMPVPRTTTYSTPQRSSKMIISIVGGPISNGRRTT